MADLVPGPDDELSQGLWRGHDLFSSDNAVVAEYARFVLDERKLGDLNFWELGYAESFLDLLAVIENERRLAPVLAERNARRSLDDVKTGAVYLFDACLQQGMQLGSILDRWRIHWRGEYSELDEVLWSEMLAEDSIASLQPYVLAKRLCEARDSGATEIGRRLRQAGCPSEDAVGRRLSELLKAHKRHRHPGRS